MGNQRRVFGPRLVHSFFISCSRFFPSHDRAERVNALASLGRANNRGEKDVGLSRKVQHTHTDFYLGRVKSSIGKLLLLLPRSIIGGERGRSQIRFSQEFKIFFFSSQDKNLPNPFAHARAFHECPISQCAQESNEP